MRENNGSALVVGAGIAGIRAALDLAEVGTAVTLIDRSPGIGGVLSKLDRQFPTDRCGMCRMLPLVDRDAGVQQCLRRGLFHENIDVLLSTEVARVEGEAGSFSVTLRRRESWIDPGRCIGCGACAQVCPVQVADGFNEGLSMRKAAYLPVPHALPNPYVIDLAACSRCGECEKACPTGAVHIAGQARSAFRILVVDDEGIIRESLKAWLEDEAGFSVDTAESGEQALTMLEEGGYRLMLLDIKMPGIDGVEALTRAKEIDPELFVVMMTAYATVETAVEAMKIGALDYLVKPFDPETLIPKIVEIYGNLQAAEGPRLDVGAIVLCGGTAYYDPSTGKDTFGYGAYPNVVTNLEFERIMSGTGPFAGALKRPGDEKPAEKIAWLQCVGSRDLQAGADFCSSICCMISIKEAILAKEASGGRIDTAVFYMDMRTFGKPYQRYRDRAEADFGVRFERGRVHSVVRDEDTGGLLLNVADRSGAMRTESFDMVVLAVGQRPSPGTEELADMLDIPVNRWGFCRPEPFSLTRTAKPGVFLGGAHAGLKDISESVLQASAAALGASRTLHESRSAASAPGQPAEYADVSREPPRILVAVCTCGETFSAFMDRRALSRRLKQDPAVADVVVVDQICTEQGWQSLIAAAESRRPNRILIGACLPQRYTRRLSELGARIGLDPMLMAVVDLRSPVFSVPEADAHAGLVAHLMENELAAGAARLKRMPPGPAPSVPVLQNALVVGGGVAGMTAALGIADHGFDVDLVEAADRLGGNLHWIAKTLEGDPVEPLLEETRNRVEKHSRIRVHTKCRVVGGYGRVGRFHTSAETDGGKVETFDHGVAILATGGTEASTTAYGYGKSEAVVTQKELEQKLGDGTVDPAAVGSAVFIQCVGSREEPRNYCSRVCCATTLKQALALKEKNPDIDVYVLYRDMTVFGFAESVYTNARRAGILFIQYEVDEKPEAAVESETGPVTVTVRDPILGRPVQIVADLLVLATGISAALPEPLAAAFGAAVDSDGFLQEAEFKWRPVDAQREGVFGCGIAQAPRTITESIAAAEAAAQRALRILHRESLPSGRVVASVRHAICSLCQRCIDACPYGARFVDEDLEQITVNPVMCQGCGSCATVCPNDAAIVEGFTAPQLFETIDAAMESMSG